MSSPARSSSVLSTQPSSGYASPRRPSWMPYGSAPSHWQECQNLHEIMCCFEDSVQCLLTLTIPVHMILVFAEAGAASLHYFAITVTITSAPAAAGDKTYQSKACLRLMKGLEVLWHSSVDMAHGSASSVIFWSQSLNLAEGAARNASVQLLPAHWHHIWCSQYIFGPEMCGQMKCSGRKYCKDCRTQSNRGHHQPCAVNLLQHFEILPRYCTGVSRVYLCDGMQRAQTRCACRLVSTAKVLQKLMV